MKLCEVRKTRGWSKEREGSYRKLHLAKAEGDDQMGYLSTSQ